MPHAQTDQQGDACRVFGFDPGMDGQPHDGTTILRLPLFYKAVRIFLTRLGLFA
jgi:hypothetical protein